MSGEDAAAGRPPLKVSVSSSTKTGRAVGVRVHRGSTLAETLGDVGDVSIHVHSTGGTAVGVEFGGRSSLPEPVQAAMFDLSSVTGDVVGVTVQPGARLGDVLGPGAATTIRVHSDSGTAIGLQVGSARKPSTSTR
jgi:hypothetical protein